MKNHEWAPGQSRWAECTHPTIGHYEENAESFKEGTWDHDVSQNLDARFAPNSRLSPNSDGLWTRSRPPGTPTARGPPDRPGWLLDSVSWRLKLRGVGFAQDFTELELEPASFEGFCQCRCFIFHRTPSMQFFGTCGRPLSPMSPLCLDARGGDQRLEWSAIRRIPHRNGGMGFGSSRFCSRSLVLQTARQTGTSNLDTPPSRGRYCQTPEQKRFLLVVFFSCPAFLADSLVGEFLDSAKMASACSSNGVPFGHFPEDTHFFLGTG